jgi:hypothetical protein
MTAMMNQMQTKSHGWEGENNMVNLWCTILNPEFDTKLRHKAPSQQLKAQASTALRMKGDKYRTDMNLPIAMHMTLPVNAEHHSKQPSVTTAAASLCLRTFSRFSPERQQSPSATPKSFGRPWWLS